MPAARSPPARSRKTISTPNANNFSLRVVIVIIILTTSWDYQQVDLAPVDKAVQELTCVLNTQ